MLRMIDSDISHRCRDAWNSLPSHLHYTSSCWDANVPVGVCTMLITSYLVYLYNEFLIQRLLVQQNPDSSAELLEISSTILSTVLTLCSQRVNAVDLQPDYLGAVSFFFFCARQFFNFFPPFFPCLRINILECSGLNFQLFRSYSTACLAQSSWLKPSNIKQGRDNRFHTKAPDRL